MIPDVELMTVKEFEEALDGYLILANLPVINYILTRRNFPDCVQFSNTFIANKTGVSLSIVQEIDTLTFKPIFQFFSVLFGIKRTDGSQGIDLLPWTGGYLVEENALSLSVFNKTNLCLTVVNKITLFTHIVESESSTRWINKNSEAVVYYIIFNKSETEFRVDSSGYSNLPKFITLSSIEELVRYHIMMHYMHNAILPYGFLDRFSSTTLTSNDPVYEIIQLDDWKVTPSLHWSNRLDEFNRAASDLVPKTREEAIKIISKTFSKEIEEAKSFSVFLEEYFPRMSLGTIASYCLINQDNSTKAVEQPA